MVTNLLIGIGAGLASVLLHAALLTASPLALPLFFLAPLPIAIAGFGWGPQAGAAAALTVAVAAAIATSPLLAAIVFILFAGPTAWTVYLLGLSRPVAETAGEREWYPLGRALAYGAAMVGGGLILAGLLLNYDPDQLATAMLAALQAWLTASEGAAPPASELDAFVRTNVAVLPFTTSAIGLAMLVFNAWAGARIAAASGRLMRPRTPLWSTDLPRWTVGAFAAAALVGFTGGPIGLAGQVVAGSFGFAFGLSGLAVLHVVTLGRAGRGAILFLTYAVLIILAVTMVVFVPVGIADMFSRIRARRGAPLS